MADSSETLTDGPEDDPATYEQKCLADTREQLTRVTSHEVEPYELRDVRLEGRYRDTQIVVSLWDRRYDKEVTRHYAIWREPSFVGSSGVRESPEAVAMLVTTWSLDG